MKRCETNLVPLLLFFSTEFLYSFCFSLLIPFVFVFSVLFFSLLFCRNVWWHRRMVATRARKVWVNWISDSPPKRWTRTGRFAAAAKVSARWIIASQPKGKKSLQICRENPIHSLSSIETREFALHSGRTQQSQRWIVVASVSLHQFRPGSEINQNITKHLFPDVADGVGIWVFFFWGFWGQNRGAHRSLNYSLWNVRWNSFIRRRWDTTDGGAIGTGDFEWWWAN